MSLSCLKSGTVATRLPSDYRHSRPPSRTSLNPTSPSSTSPFSRISAPRWSRSPTAPHRRLGCSTRAAALPSTPACESTSDQASRTAPPDATRREAAGGSYKGASRPSQSSLVASSPWGFIPRETDSSAVGIRCRFQSCRNVRTGVTPVPKSSRR